jgi:hypothetical protein
MLKINSQKGKNKPSNHVLTQLEWLIVALCTWCLSLLCSMQK